MMPFNRPAVLGHEIENIRQALEKGKLSGDGEFTLACNGWLQQRLGVQRALLTHSCTAALEMAALLCDVGPGDEVIMPSFTFASTANAVVLRGGVPVFVDIDPQTLNVNPSAIEAAITERTRAIFVVHYAGVPCDMDAIAAIAKAESLIVVEDAAQALGSTYKGRPAGALGQLAAFSFHETKNIVSGEGGALAISEPSMVARAEIIREKGTNRSRFLRGEVDKYTWVDVGSSYLPSEITAAFLYAQLQQVDEINRDRKETWALFHESFADLEHKGHIQRPQIPGYAEHNAHMYYLLLPSAEERSRFIGELKAVGVTPTFHYIPLHSSPAGQVYGRAAGQLAHTDRISEILVRLPMYFGMADERDRVIDAVRQFFHEK